MGGVEDRIKKLEQREDSEAAGPYSDASPAERCRHTDRVLHLHENARREREGLEPLPMPDELRETKDDILRVLRETIPAYRADRGWRSAESQAFLDQWEDGCLQRLSELSKGDDE